MRRYGKAWIGALAALMILGAAFVPARADDDEDDPIKIPEVTIEMNLSQPEAGNEVEEDLSDAFSVPGDADYEITGAEYVNDSDDNWANGKKPVIDVTLEPVSDDYEFKSGLKVHLKSDTETDSCHLRSRKKDEAVVRIRLKTVRGTIDEPENPTWSDTTTASWDAVEGAKNYKVKLYRDDEEVSTVSTTALSYNFASSMMKKGKYTFEVKAEASKDDDDSSWSEESEDQVIDDSNMPEPAPADTAAQTAASGLSEVRVSDGGSWQKDGDFWTFVRGGQPVKNSWLLGTDGSWYVIGADGHMATGWYRDTNGLWYLFRAEGTDAYPLGSMKTGWYTEGNQWYYLRPEDGGPKGSMVTGSVTIDGSRYTFAENGALYGTR